MSFARPLYLRFAFVLLASTHPLRAASAPAEGTSHRIPDLGIDLRWLAPGSFTRGGDEGGADEKAGTRVTLSKGFWLGRTEVTQGQYQAVMGSNPSNFKSAGRAAPVENVSWKDAMEFCRKLTERERAAGRLPGGYEFTLPSEAQWEFACRAGASKPVAIDLDATAWHGGNSEETTHAVGQKRANAWGFHDLFGNVWEWCLDWYAERLPGGNVTDPAGAATGTLRVIRGGGWGSAANVCHPGFRWGSPDFCYTNLGFRIALSPRPPARNGRRMETADARRRPGRAEVGGIEPSRKT